MSGDTPAEALLRSLGITSPDEIDLEAIAWSMGAKVREAELPSCEARIIGFQDRAIITVRNSGDPRRRRFSIGHELGHWIHHRGRSSICRSNDIGNPGAASQLEKQADRFAADLLMPRFLFGPLVSQLKRPSFEGIDELATAFSTSRLATSLRCIEMGSWPTVLICHGTSGRRWFKRAASVPDDWFPREDIDSSSPSFPILFGNVERTTSQGVAASLWFNRGDSNRYSITEQSLKAHGGMMLTLLTLTDPKMLTQRNR